MLIIYKVILEKSIILDEAVYII